LVDILNVAVHKDTVAKDKHYEGAIQDSRCIDKVRTKKNMEPLDRNLIKISLNQVLFRLE